MHESLLRPRYNTPRYTDYVLQYIISVLHTGIWICCTISITILPFIAVLDHLIANTRIWLLNTKSYIQEDQLNSSSNTECRSLELNPPLPNSSRVTEHMCYSFSSRLEVYQEICCARISFRRKRSYISHLFPKGSSYKFRKHQIHEFFTAKLSLKIGKIDIQEILDRE